MAANRYRPRAPSPKHGDTDSDNTYSLVQDSMRDRKMSQHRLDRMFGDSANEDDLHQHRSTSSRNVHRGNNKFGSVSSNSTNSSSLRGGGGGSLASLYQARKQTVQKVAEATTGAPGNSHYDAATVEQIKAQFQAQIEAMMLSQVSFIFLQFLLWLFSLDCKLCLSASELLMRGCKNYRNERAPLFIRQ